VRREVLRSLFLWLPEGYCVVGLGTGERSRLAAFVKRRRLERRLKELQRAYYRAAEKSDAVIAEYLRTLRELHAETSPPHARIRHGALCISVAETTGSTAG
jgi:hypothetical protein